MLNMKKIERGLIMEFDKNVVEKVFTFSIDFVAFCNSFILVVT